MNDSLIYKCRRCGKLFEVEIPDGIPADKAMNDAITGRPEFLRWSMHECYPAIPSSNMAAGLGFGELVGGNLFERSLLQVPVKTIMGN